MHRRGISKIPRGCLIISDSIIAESGGKVKRKRKGAEVFVLRAFFNPFQSRHAYRMFRSRGEMNGS